MSCACYLALCGYIAALYSKKLAARRLEVVNLYIRRANLMPVFFAAARKFSPIPMDIHNRFVSARDRLAASADTAGNKIMDAVFEDFFKIYKNCREPLYIKTYEDYTKIMEKIHFVGKFYEDERVGWERVQRGPLRFGLAIVKDWGKNVVQ